MLSVVLLSLGLALDAVSVSIAEGAATKANRGVQAFKLAFTFGFFQSGMPLAGVLILGFFEEGLWGLDRWIAFGIFTLLGLKMFKEAWTEKEESKKELSLKILILLGIATSIDSLAAGFTLPMLDFPVGGSVFLIGIITFILSYLGAFFGGLLSRTFTKLPLEVMGGVLLIALGIKSLLF